MGWFSWIGKGEVSTCRDEGKVCAYEWDGKLYRTKREMERAREAKRLRDAKQKIVSHLKSAGTGNDYEMFGSDRDHCRVHGYGLYNKMMSMEQLVEVLVDDWDVLDKLMKEIK